MTVADVALAPSGELYVLDADGTIRFQSPEIGVEYQNIPPSLRPAYVWKIIDPPPAPVKRIFAAHGGKLMALTETGVLFERVPARDARMFPVHVWKSLNTGEDV